MDFPGDNELRHVGNSVRTLVALYCWLHQVDYNAIHCYQYHQRQLEQLERPRSEDTPRRPMITHTIDQFILNLKSILLTSSYRILSQNKVKAEKLEKFAKNLNLEFCYKCIMPHTL